MYREKSPDTFITFLELRLLGSIIEFAVLARICLYRMIGYMLIPHDLVFSSPELKSVLGCPLCGYAEGELILFIITSVISWHILDYRRWAILGQLQTYVTNQDIDLSNYPPYVMRFLG